MTILKLVGLALIGLSGGVTVAAGIFAFIAVLGVIPRMAQRTKTIRFIPVYEDAIVLGGILGTCTMFVDFYFPIGKIFVAIAAMAVGAFIGSLAISLAEVLNVVPIFLRRSRLTIGVPLFLLAMALGKLIGALLYALVPGFFTMF